MKARDNNPIQMRLQVNKKFQSDQQDALYIFTVKELTESWQSDTPQ
ncbi:hypothetical protein PghCCS26_41540 [Paenibacillus glycanilyticus]|uniref:Uncharacterized protein n=1 Tax=Paenibacillus glycanilyticus TaxID=126569 RepID=A0ABQ6NSJ9_9BACL|nr:hypothetical protein PghCCS26_41540 [Paenibacillus glycanilyticus]